MIRTPRRSVPKRTRKTKTKKSKKPNLYLIAAIAVILLSIASIVTAMLYIKQNPPPLPNVQINIQKNQTVTPPIKTTDNAVNITDANETLPLLPISTKPKLVIIIDDVTFPKQIEKILSIPLRITPSFLPPSQQAPFSAELAKRCEFYMVHLPLEAMKFERPEAVTIWVSDSYDEILEKLSVFKRQFPRAIYYNNHTGSKFTADIDAMRRLINAMDELDLVFVDSRTIAQTKAPEIFAEQGRKLLQRDVFLDNEIEEKAIKAQLLIAVEKAKERGFAIAIGHPHDKTLDTIAKSLNVLKDVEVVYLKDL
ncbi:MAG: divergent polysaccharide deacetylase family protein [Campylobacteraceae bacterium]|nr:divergent polysaccharide deacetylase family protein [Campylobacteraceae bacterium]